MLRILAAASILDVVAVVVDTAMVDIAGAAVDDVNTVAVDVAVAVNA
jgi:hypothetical protein